MRTTGTTTVRHKQRERESSVGGAPAGRRTDQKTLTYCKSCETTPLVVPAIPCAFFPLVRESETRGFCQVFKHGEVTPPRHSCLGPAAHLPPGGKSPTKLESVDVDSDSAVVVGDLEKCSPSPSYRAGENYYSPTAPPAIVDAAGTFNAGSNIQEENLILRLEFARSPPNRSRSPLRSFALPARMIHACVGSQRHHRRLLFDRKEVSCSYKSAISNSPQF